MTKRRPGGGTPQFGGDWTETKLAVVAEYLVKYTTALQHQPFRRVYIDAFAGSGYREPREDERDESDPTLPFPDLAEAEPQGLLDGSARRALRTSPPFDQYVFIELSAARCAQLEQLRSEFPEFATRIDIRQGDANHVIREVCRTDWRAKRAVLFLDPYGMQVEWSTIEAVAATKAIDTWILFPLGIGVNRLLERSGRIPNGWRHRLDLILGTPQWFEDFYKVKTTPTLFGSEEEQVRTAAKESIGRYFVQRLKSVFHDASETPRVLSNSRGTPLYLLCFAVGNPKGAPIALRIANHILQKGAD